MAHDDQAESIDSTFNSSVTRREFIKVSAVAIASVSLGSLLTGCGSTAKDTSHAAAEPVFFVHISDSHFGGETLLGESQDPTMLQVAPKALLTTLISEILPVVDPLATIHTGDIVNEGFQLKPWQSYRDVISNTGNTLRYPKNYIEIPGNHDAKNNDTATFGRDIGDGRQLFNQYSIIGQALGATGDKFGLTELTSPHGVVRMVRTNTAESPTDNNTENINGYFSAEQQHMLLGDPGLKSTSFITVVLGHHPVTGENKIAIGNELMTEIIDSVKAPIYLCGHVHEPVLMWYGNTLVVQADTFGRHGSLSSFYIVAYDENKAAAKLVTIDASKSPGIDWPIVFITAPVSSTLGNDNPNATAYTSGQFPNLRTLVFSPDANPVTNVTYSIDGGTFDNGLQQSTKRLWESSLKTQGLTPGTHTVTVRATLSNGQIGEDSISIKIQ